MKSGDKVVYIQKSLPGIGLIKNNIYEILETTLCNCVNGLHLNVGISMPESSPFSYCQTCGAILNIDERWFLHHSGFAPVSKHEIGIEFKESKLGTKESHS